MNLKINKISQDFGLLTKKIKSFESHAASMIEDTLKRESRSEENDVDQLVCVEMQILYREGVMESPSYVRLKRVAQQMAEQKGVYFELSPICYVKFGITGVQDLELGFQELNSCFERAKNDQKGYLLGVMKYFYLDGWLMINGDELKSCLKFLDKLFSKFLSRL